MASYIVDPFEVTIPSGQTNSNAIPADEVYDDAIALTIIAPASLQGAVSGLIQILVNPDDPVASYVFAGFEEGESGALFAVTSPAAGLARAYFNLAVTPGFRIVLNAPVGADVTFEVWKQIGVTF